MNFRILFNTPLKNGVVMRKLILTRDEALKSPFKPLIEELIATPARLEVVAELPVFGLTKVVTAKQKEENHAPIFNDGF